MGNGHKTVDRLDTTGHFPTDERSSLRCLGVYHRSAGHRSKLLTMRYPSHSFRLLYRRASRIFSRILRRTRSNIVEVFLICAWLTICCLRRRPSH